MHFLIFLNRLYLYHDFSRLIDHSKQFTFQVSFTHTFIRRVVCHTPFIHCRIYTKKSVSVVSVDTQTHREKNRKYIYFL